MKKILISFILIIFIPAIFWGNDSSETGTQQNFHYANLSQIYLMLGKNISITYQYPGNQKMTENGILQKIYPDAIILKINNRKIRLIRSCYIKKIKVNQGFF